MSEGGGDQGTLERFRVEMERAQARQKGGLDFLLSAGPPRGQRR